MPYLTAEKRALRRELRETVNDPFDLLVQALERCERLEIEVRLLKTAHLRSKTYESTLQQQNQPRSK